jgi:hypothetical protein
LPDLPHLRRLMDASFHQDYDLMGDSDAAILRQFAASSHQADVDGALSEIDGLLAAPTAGLLRHFTEATGAGNMMIGDDDAGARAWLEQARATLAAATGR